MWTRFLNVIIGAFSVFYQVIKVLFTWIFEHTWSFVIALFFPLIGLFNSLTDLITFLLNDVLENIWSGSSYQFSTCWDAIDAILQSFLGDSFLAMILKDVIYVFNFGAFIENCFEIVIPLLINCLVYKVIKSWIPTVSGT